MNKKCLTVITILQLLVFSFVCRAGNKYEEARDVYEDYVPVIEKYLDTVEKTQNPKELARAINVFTDSMEGLVPKIRNLTEKYPELVNEESIPPEYADLVENANVLGGRFAMSFARIAPFLADPEVEKANERLMVVMAEMAGQEN